MLVAVLVVASMGKGKTGKPRALEGDPEVDEVEPGETLDEFLRENLRTSEIEVRAPGPGGLPSLAFLQAHFKTKSASIRYMNTLGHKPAVIAKHLGFRYQMVRNILTNQLKRGPNEDFTIPSQTPEQDLEVKGEVQEAPGVSGPPNEKQGSPEEGDW